MVGGLLGAPAGQIIAGEAAEIPAIDRLAPERAGHTDELGQLARAFNELSRGSGSICGPSARSWPTRRTNCGRPSR